MSTISGDMTIADLVDLVIEAEVGAVKLKWAAVPSVDMIENHVEKMLASGYTCGGVEEGCSSHSPEDCLRGTTIVCPSIESMLDDNPDEVSAEDGFTPVLVHVSVGTFGMAMQSPIDIAMTLTAVAMGLDVNDMCQAHLELFKAKHADKIETIEAWLDDVLPGGEES